MSIDVDNEDWLLDGDEEPKTTEPGASPWVILVVDDDETVHETTALVLSSEVLLGRPIHTLDAFSAAEGFEVFKLHRHEIVLAIIDVTMERDNAGLDLVRNIRKFTDSKDVRIILRTGQPGTGDQATIIQTYDINGYLLKSEITKIKLLSAILIALRDRQTIHELIEQVNKVESLLAQAAELFGHYLASKESEIKGSQVGPELEADNEVIDTKNIFITYVTQKDRIDSEHTHMSSCLKRLISESAGNKVSANANLLLEEFFRLLDVHHSSEDEFMSKVDRKHAAYHMKAHQVIREEAATILDSSKTGLLEINQVRHVLSLLEAHIRTLDRELGELIDAL